MKIADPQPGHYRTRLVRGGVWVGVRIWWEDGIRCTETGDLLSDQILRAEIDGRAVDPHDAWLRCADEPIPEAEYLWLIADRRHARDWRPNDPEATPRAPVNLNAIKPLF